MSSAHLAQEITLHLSSRGLAPIKAWVNSFLAGQRTSAIPALKQTALFRILHSDIGTTLQTSLSSVFPTDISNGEIREQRVVGPIPVQILDIEDIGRSKWSQLEALEAEERGEKVKGREIIRLVPGEEDDNQTQTASTGPHKLIVQDAQGTCVYAMELLTCPGLDLNINIGAKLVLRNVTVARGVLLLEPKSVTSLGGKIEPLHKAWKERRKEALRNAAQSSSDNAP